MIIDLGSAWEVAIPGSMALPCPALNPGLAASPCGLAVTYFGFCGSAVLRAPNYQGLLTCLAGRRSVSCRSLVGALVASSGPLGCPRRSGVFGRFLAIECWPWLDETTVSRVHFWPPADKSHAPVLFCSSRCPFRTCCALVHFFLLPSPLLEF